MNLIHKWCTWWNCLFQLDTTDSNTKCWIIFIYISQKWQYVISTSANASLYAKWPHSFIVICMLSYDSITWARSTLYVSFSILCLWLYKACSTCVPSTLDRVCVPLKGPVSLQQIYLISVHDYDPWPWYSLAGQTFGQISYMKLDGL